MAGGHQGFFYTSGSRTWRRPWWVWGAHCVPPEGKFAHVSISHTQNMPAVKSDESACPLTPPVLLFPSWRSREWRRGWGGGRINECSPPPHCRPLCLRQARDIGCWIPALTLDGTGLKIPKNNRTPTELLGKHRLCPRRHPRMGKNNLQSLFEADVLVKYFVVSKVLRKGAWKDPAKYRMTQKSTSRSSRKSQLGNET